MSNRIKKAAGAMVLVLAAGVAVGFSTLGRGMGQDDDEKVVLADVPAAVRKTIQSHLDGGKIDEIERSREQGRVVYDVDVEGAHGDFEFIVAEDGTYLGKDTEDGDDENADGDHDDNDNEDADNGDDDENGDAEGGGDEEQTTEIGFGEAPAAVRQAFARVAGGVDASLVERITDEDTSWYELEYPKAGATASVTMSEAGQMMEIETPVRLGDLPEVVRKELLKDYPDAKIAEASAVQLFFYEFKIKSHGKTFEVIAFSNGDIEDEQANGDDGDGEHADGDDNGDDGEHADGDDGEDNDEHGDEEEDEGDDD